MPRLTNEQVTKWYLYGDDIIPLNFVDESLIRSPSAPGSHPQLRQDLPTYMEDGPGRFALGAQFGFVSRFFSRDRTNPDEPYAFNIPAGVYTQAEIAQRVGLGDQFRNITFSNWQFDDGENDYAQRTYVWGTVSFEIENTARFVVTADGQRYIDNFKVKPFTNEGHPENFDFKGGDWTGLIGGASLQANTDPSRIGRTVDFEFTGELPPAIRYNEAQYLDDVATKATWTIYGIPPVFPVVNDRLITEMATVEQQLWDAGITKFLDGNRPVVYGTTDVDILDRWMPSSNRFLNPLVKNGLIYLAAAATTGS